MSLEVVKYRESGNSLLTVQLALNGALAVPLTVERSVFWSYNDTQRHEWLARTARTLLDIYGDARDGRILSDHEVLQATSA